ncbi:LETM1-like protein [Halocaridina rubra]|uniref:LETM1-like protein n=1 Tax=Halocaridina rubra TaxID=373956 RepID=A0AAN9AE94_HALRR
MAGVFGGIIYCSRYERVLHIPCYFCLRIQLGHCLKSPCNLVRDISTSSATSKVNKQVTSTQRKLNYLVFRPLSFQRLSCLHNGWVHGGHFQIQSINYFSTKKNIAVKHEEERIVNEMQDEIDHKESKTASTICRRTESHQVTQETTESQTKVSSSAIVTDNESLTEVSKSTIDNKIGDEKMPSRLQRFVLWRFTWYLKRFQKSLENEMPDTFHMFRIFSIGLKDFIVDFKDFIKVLIILSMPGTTLRSLSRRDMELYYNMPGDMFRVFPILVISSLPFGQNIAFPVGYWFPKQLLCHHFWDLKQRQDFAVLALKKRLFNARPVFRSMQNALLTIENQEDRERCRSVFYKIGSGIHPSSEEVISILHLFQGHPFHIKNIRITHANGLLRLHGKSVWFRSTSRLKDHARMLHYLDTAISREGLNSLTFDQLKTSLFLRGLNPTNMSTKSMTEFLETWLSVSREVDSSSYSLLLHLPILLSYNQPSNFALIY